VEADIVEDNLARILPKVEDEPCCWGGLRGTEAQTELLPRGTERGIAVQPQFW
jgi:hypothetical protein